MTKPPTTRREARLVAEAAAAAETAALFDVPVALGETHEAPGRRSVVAAILGGSLAYVVVIGIGLASMGGAFAASHPDVERAAGTVPHATRTPTPGATDAPTPSPSASEPTPDATPTASAQPPPRTVVRTPAPRPPAPAATPAPSTAPAGPGKSGSAPGHLPKPKPTDKP